MPQYFTKTFFKFLTAFLTILIIAFVALAVITRENAPKPVPVDTVAGAN